MKKQRTKIGFLFAIIFLASCQGKSIFSDYQTLPSEGWNATESVEIKFTPKDTTSKMELQLFVRNDDSYAYQNLWFFVDQIAPNGEVKTDTIQCFLVDNYGRWIGSGIGSLYYVAVKYCEDYRFSSSGEYVYKIRHGMRCDTLNGIKQVGLKILKSE